MAYCPFCGKQLPPDGVCSCQANKVNNAPAEAVQNAAPQQPVPQQVPPQAVPVAPAAPAGPNPFGEAFKLFGSVFKKPAETSQDVFTGKISVASGMVLGGLYFLVVWISMLLLLLGEGGHMKFLRAFGYGALAALFFCGMRVGAAALISVFAKNKNAGFVKVLAALCVDTIILDCVLIVMSLFQFATVYFAVFFMLIYVGLVFYQNIEMLKNLSTGMSKNKAFWLNVTLLCFYALIIMIAYIIYNNVVTASVADAFESLFDW